MQFYAITLWVVFILVWFYYRSAEYEAKVSENDLYMSGEDLVLDAVSVKKGAGAVVSVWLNPKVIDTIELSVKATCTSGASDGFIRELLITV